MRSSNMRKIKPGRLILVTSLVVFLGCFSGCKGESTAGAQNGTQSGDPAGVKTETVGNLLFYRDEAYGLKKAKRENRPVFIDFYADWCVNCKLFQKDANKYQKLNAALQKAVLIKVYDTDPVFKTYQENPKYKELNQGLPLFLVLGPAGDLRFKTQDYKDHTGMIKAISL